MALFRGKGIRDYLAALLPGQEAQGHADDCRQEERRDGEPHHAFRIRDCDKYAERQRAAHRRDKEEALNASKYLPSSGLSGSPTNPWPGLSSLYAFASVTIFLTI